VNVGPSVPRTALTCADVKLRFAVAMPERLAPPRKGSYRLPRCRRSASGKHRESIQFQRPRRSRWRSHQPRHRSRRCVDREPIQTLPLSSMPTGDQGQPQRSRGLLAAGRWRRETACGARVVNLMRAIVKCKHQLGGSSSGNDRPRIQLFTGGLFGARAVDEL
jgi:hypothetical protein